MPTGTHRAFIECFVADLLSSKRFAPNAQLSMHVSCAHLLQICVLWMHTWLNRICVPQYVYTSDPVAFQDVDALCVGVRKGAILNTKPHRVAARCGPLTEPCSMRTISQRCTLHLPSRACTCTLVHLDEALVKPPLTYVHCFAGCKQFNADFYGGALKVVPIPAVCSPVMCSPGHFQTTCTVLRNYRQHIPPSERSCLVD